jgi:hypothetical protein
LGRSAKFDRWSSNIIVRKVQGYPPPERASPDTFFSAFPEGGSRCLNFRAFLGVFRFA